MLMIVRVWDAPTRLFHWALVACFIGLLVTSQIGGSAMVWHFRLGYMVMALLLFRIVWGIYGGYWARFSTFLYGPGRILAHLQGRSSPLESVGHNPLGALSVFAMFAFLSIQVLSGLMSDDEIASAGPLSRFVSATWVSNATFYHKNIGKLLLITLVLAHLGAIVFYFIKKGENLVTPMLNGDKKLSFDAPSTSDTSADRRKAAIVFVSMSLIIVAAIAWLD
jgi:cytochrome b